MFVVFVTAPHLCFTAHKTQRKVPTTQTMEARLPPFFYEDFSFSVQAPTVPCGPKFGRPDMSSLVYSRECARATALFVSSFGADLVAEV